jgi:MIP family channel proteins
MPSLTRRAIAEMLGTAMLVFFGAAVVIMNPFPKASFGVFGFAVGYAMIYGLAVSMTMNISGGHLNPAVSIALLVVRRLSALDTFVYVVSQLAGALAAAALVRALIPNNVAYLVGYGTPALYDLITVPKGIALEALFTFVLMSAMMTTVVTRRGPKIAGWAVGLSLIPIGMVGGPLTGGIANPARAFGPAIISGVMTAQSVWWIGPIIGAILAALVWQYVLPDGGSEAAG